jgi:hypothetical protein
MTDFVLQQARMSALFSQPLTGASAGDFASHRGGAPICAARCLSLAKRFFLWHHNLRLSQPLTLSRQIVALEQS